MKFKVDYYDYYDSGDWKGKVEKSTLICDFCWKVISTDVFAYNPNQSMNKLVDV